MFQTLGYTSLLLSGQTALFNALANTNIDWKETSHLGQQAEKHPLLPDMTEDVLVHSGTMTAAITKVGAKAFSQF